MRENSKTISKCLGRINIFSTRTVQMLVYENSIDNSFVLYLSHMTVLIFLLKEVSVLSLRSEVDILLRSDQSYKCVEAEFCFAVYYS